MGWLLPYFTMSLLMIIGFLLIVIILLQRGRGGGLAGALGGMGGQSAFGTKAGDMFTRITIILATVWMVVAVGNIYALQYTGKLYDGGSDATPTAPGVESTDKNDDDMTAEDAAKNAAHSLINMGKDKDTATEDTKPAVDTKPDAAATKTDDAAVPVKKAEEPKAEPAKDNAAKPEEKTEPAKAEEKTEKPAEPEAKTDEKKPE